MNYLDLPPHYGEVAEEIYEKDIESNYEGSDCGFGSLRASDDRTIPNRASWPKRRNPEGFDEIPITGIDPTYCGRSSPNPTYSSRQYYYDERTSGAQPSIATMKGYDQPYYINSTEGENSHMYYNGRIHHDTRYYHGYINSDEIPYNERVVGDSQPGEERRPISLPVATAIPTTESMGFPDSYVYHCGKGKRGSMRIGMGGLQDLSLLTVQYPSTYRTPLNQGNSASSQRCSMRSASSLSTMSQPHTPISLASDEYTEVYSHRPATAMYQRSGSSSRTYGSLSGFSGSIPCREEDVPRDEVEIIHGNQLLLSVLVSVSSLYNLKSISHWSMCSTEELNPHAPPHAKLCYDFLNSGSCRRENNHDICKYRHLPDNHIDSIMDKIKSGKIAVQLVKLVNNQYFIADLPGYSPQYPGLLNDVSIDSPICIEFCLNESCKNKNCPNRHLAVTHPERIALLYLNGRLSPEEEAAWALSKCSKNEVNPFSNPREKLCFDFMNISVCKRNQEGKICRFRHLLKDHADAISDRRKNCERTGNLH